MKKWICCTTAVAILGLTGYVAAQVNMPKHATSVTYGPSSSPTQITATDITCNEAQRTTYARGNVKIVRKSRRSPRTKPTFTS